MKILGIESSCDETAAAILDDTTLLSNVVVSQIDIFKSYGGVIPEVAARSHLEAILPVIDQAFDEANVTWDDIDAIAVTHTPGLLGSLLIGTLTARTLAILHNKPLYAVHHLKSHIYSNWLPASGETVPSPAVSAGYDRPDPWDTARTKSEGRASAAPATAGGCDLRSTERTVDQKRANETATPTFPLLALVISGGHTQIIYMKEHNSFEIIGTTLDDAIGECFDKVAKILGLPYPGGPSIAKAAEAGDPEKYRFPHPKINDLDFSFSGLKTAVLRTVQKECGVELDYPSHDLKKLLSEKQIADFAASFQKTAVDILLEKLELARKEHPDVKSIVFAGGVSANNALREAASTIQDIKDSEQTDLTVYFPSPKYSGDNAAMVTMAAYYEIQSGVKPTDPYTLDISPRSAIS
ncbi:tRNA (adenosine(37)-N6)-threonylcarbamoyltransferase complex transferase subunit TsaD [Candidatus Saccharibacteria bacterium]|nr:tRNA (adenosine(37)-N6)-threonylcarbamoyltransferase complex transferase subunit TsaD [Candidatus Saccharibacteria bacterium]